MLSRLMTERGDLLLLIILLKRKTASRVRSSHESDTFNVEDEELRKRMEKFIADHDESHESMMLNKADIDFRIPGLPLSLWNTRKVPAFDNWFRKLWTIQIDTLFNKIYDRINHLILIKNKRFRMLGKSNYVNYSRRNPKRIAQYVYHNRTLVYSAARAGISCTERGESAVHELYDGLSFSSWVRHQERDDFMDIYMVRSRETGNTVRLTSWGKDARKSISKAFHNLFIRDPEFRNRMIENGWDEELCRRWDAFADEDHTHHLTAQEYSLYKSKWWLHSNKQGSNTMPLMKRRFQTSIVYLATIETRSRSRLTSAYLL